MQWGPLWYPWAMKPPIFIRSLTEEERMQLEADRRIAEACRVRRAQIIRASARRLSPKPIAQLVGCAVQTVRNVIHAFNNEGVARSRKQSNRPKTAEPTPDAPHCERGGHILHQLPRTYGASTEVWTLALATKPSASQGGTIRL